MSEERANAGLSSSALLGALVEWEQDLRPMPGTGIATMYPEAAFDMSLVTKERGMVEQVTRTFWGRWKALVRHGEGFTEINVDEIRIISPKRRKMPLSED